MKKKKTVELKDVFAYEERLNALRDAFHARASAIRGKNVLLFDDLFRSGATMSAVTAAINKELPKALYVLTITRTAKS